MMVQEPAEYSEESKDGSMPYMIGTDELPKIKNVIGTNDFTKFLK
jgi:hypothetical protein